MKLNSFSSGCIATCLAVILLIALLYHGGHQTGREQTPNPPPQIVYDTIPVFIDTPVPRDSVVIKYVTVPLPVYDTIPSHHADTLVADSATVIVPITQKIYRDTTYEAWVSGYLPSLDSIRIFQPVTTITHTQIKYKPKRWGLGVQVGIGVTPNKIEPYLGIGVSYNIFSW